MLTQLGAYCQQFDSTLRPVLQDLSAVVAAAELAAPGSPGRSLHPPMVELQHQLRVLCDKVVEQQAYVLIFGPLKSGKSTLMNAIAGAYVSEVSSLPAYPCLVFVSAGPRREYVVTTYAGNATTFQDGQALHLHIDKAHGELAAAIRRAEQNGLTFDPQEHFPQAIRRVDVRVPGSELASTGAVLVDTPGLYTRMRFGYDRMTRDFRNAAACAIFVVKSDTLFLEQVFAEFEQLLDLFSRIFLVVNVDSHKRDVSPEGKLVPSLEQSRPEAVLKAFEELAMSAPLQRAAAEGRVRMYPVDLLHAASSCLQKAPLSEAPAGFQSFRNDLAAFLASSEYMASFLRDSLQRGNTLLAELLQRSNANERVALEEQLADLDEQIAWLAAEHKRLQHALTLDWSAAFARLTRDVDAEVERAARDHGAKLLRTLGASIDTWFLSSHSLEWLVQGQWTPLVRDYRDEVLAAGRRAFDQGTQQLDAGLDLPAGIPELARRAGLDLQQLVQHALAALGAVGWPKTTTVPVQVDQIPIKRGVLDVVTFRSHDRVRERLFGPNNKPDVKIPGKDKAKHLGDAGRLHLHQCVAQFRGALMPETVAIMREYFGPGFFAKATERLRQGFTDHLPRVEQKQHELAAARTQVLQQLQPVRTLEQTGRQLVTQLAELGRAFDHDLAQAQPATAPAPAKDVVIQPATRRDKPTQAPTNRGTTRRPERT
ncbi:MAG: dynamin family protein [Planctomycetes bacterium]|nr:dynamin family protein [Planctomycetota bacterium]